MNDNFIKMFIGGEEVVSNKEFTINEEMLSASSTILNNCYPASWEETKDYVSNFYYPKDYSKFILGKGNFAYGTDQYSILSVSGETFMQFTTNVEKEWNSLNVYGKTIQETRSGYNLIDLVPIQESRQVAQSGYNNYEYIYDNELGKRVFHGTRTSEQGIVYPQIAFNLFDEQTTSYRFNPTGKNLAIVFKYKTEGNFNGWIGFNGRNNWEVVGANSSSQVKDRFIPASTTWRIGSMRISKDNDEYTRYSKSYKYMCICLGATSSLNCGIYVSDIMVVEITDEEYNTTTYTPPNIEKYGVMPSPDYPSELVSVGYENIFNKNGTINGQQTTTILDTGVRITQLTSGIYKYNYISLGGSELLGKTITISSNIVSSASNKGQLSLYYANSSNPAISLVGNLTATGSATFTIASSFPSNASRVNLLLYSNTNGVGNANDYTDFTNLIITQGTQAHSYIPYGKYGIEVKTTGKNLFDEIYPSIDTSVRYKAIYVGEGTFTMSTTMPYASTYTNLFFLTGNVSSGASTGSNGVWNARSRTITSTNGYVTVGYRVADNISPKNYNTQIEKGTQKTTYEEYKSNTQLYTLDEPLRAIGEYKDRLYIENGMLYVDRKIGSVVLDGSENWDYNSGNSVFVCKNLVNYSLQNFAPYCNNYKGINIVSAYKELNNNEISFLKDSSSNRTLIKDTRYTIASDLQTWLSTHNTEVQYVLAEPYTEEIGQVNIPYSYEGINNTTFDTGIDTEETIYYYWKNFNVLFAGIVKNSGDISLRPTNPKYCSLQILDYKTFLSESDTLDFVISDKTIAEAISMVVDAISGYGFVLGTINISQANDIIGAYSTLNKTAYDVFQYLANISGSRWRARFVDSDTMAIDFYDPELLPRANDIDYTQQYWEDNKIVDLTFNYGTRDYRNKQIILSDEVYGGIDYTEVLLSNGYGTSYITQNNIANITSITVNGVEAEVITQSEKDLGVDADFYYTPGKNVVESTTSYTAGTQIIITYTPLVKGRQIVYNDEEVTRIATQTNTTGVISRYENRNDILSSD